MKNFTQSSLIFLIALFTGLTIQAQHQLCPTPDLDLLKQRLMENKDRVDQSQLSPRSDTEYIPIKFHLVARSDGSGRALENNVYEGLCNLNNAYESLGLQFFIKDNEFNYIDNDNAYENPVPGMLILSVHKDDEAMNIYVTGQAGSGPSGTTLGYYSPSDDWIICRKDQIKDLVTLPHEVGHFFSLMHTFHGWGCDPYDPQKHGNPVNSIIAPCANGSGLQVELADGSNCEQAGDMLCDTRPDYNFGLGAQDCDYDPSPPVKDPNGDVVDPMENNYMSYFLQCTDYEFTQDQIDVILADYNSSRRDYLRTSYEPTAITDASFEILKPKANSQTQYQDKVEFDWTDVDGATSYLLEINKFFSNLSNPTYRIIVEGQSEYTLEDDLGANTNYYYRVTPLNDYNTCLSENRSATIKFKTGDWFTATEEISRSLSWEVYPNPLDHLNQMVVQVTAEENTDAKLQLVNTQGQVVQTRQELIRRGDNTINWDGSDEISNGIYLLRIITENAQASQRIIIQ